MVMVSLNEFWGDNSSRCLYSLQSWVVGGDWYKYVVEWCWVLGVGSLVTSMTRIRNLAKFVE